MTIYHGGRVHVHAGDCRAVLAGMEPDSFDACVTDPPYHFASIVKRWGGQGSPPVEGVFRRSTKGFMGKIWDGGQIAHEPETWATVLGVLKPGAHLVAFGAPKNWHRLAIAIEDAGFEIRDNLLWLFGSGFPKSLNLGNGFGTALKPAYEPIVLARKPLALGKTIAGNVMEHGTGGLNIDACRVGIDADERATIDNRSGEGRAAEGWGHIGNRQSGGERFKSHELGRWPANVVHDGSPEVAAGFPETDSGAAHQRNNGPFKSVAKGQDRANVTSGGGDSGSAARFFYTAKADADDRIGSKHPTIKPVDLMQWLMRLITPPRGLILDPFAGTGTTAEAALREGFRCALIENDPESLTDIDRRMTLAFEGSVGRNVAMQKLRTSKKYFGVSNLSPEGEPLPLFVDL
jgi:site-specific DNA-methyltransferase (adenine-specific)